jgi:hypothetical protein
MNADELLAGLLGTQDSFERALVHVHKVEPVGLLLGLMARLDSENALANSERERRFNAVYARVSLGVSPTAVGEAAANLQNAVLRNAVAQLLPPKFKGLVFRRQTPPSRATNLPVDSSEAQDEPVVQVDASQDEQQTSFSDVIILSIIDDPATNKLLESRGLTPLRCPSLEKLDEMLAINEDVCAFLVESSFLQSLSHDQQTRLINKLAGFSTFCWVRFQEDGLQLGNAEISQMIANGRCRTSHPAAVELSFRSEAGLRERELEYITGARKRLLEGKSAGLFIPGELKDSELKLLGAAMSGYSKQRRFNPRAELTRVKTTFLPGGGTGAKVALVKINDLRFPVIVKLDQKDSVLDEARRFLTFIHKDNPELNPEVHLHGSAALIVFGMILESGNDVEQPAPTLEDEFLKYWYGEMRDPALCGDGDSLLSGFTDAAKRLAALNKQKCVNQSFVSKANPYLKLLKGMEEKGFDWGFADGVIASRDAAEALTAPASQSAVCHGDAHARNVLIRRDQGLLIDYAYSGPGHPCCDLVKLELSVYFNRFVLFGSESDAIELQRDLTVARLPISELLSKHKGLLHSRTNQLCLRMCVIARDHVGEVLAAHKLGWDHYTAMKILSSWQSLQVPNLQQSLVRGVIAAIDL